jgi:hypothetical protein
MATWVWVVVVVAVVVAALAVVAWLLVSKRRSQELRQRFGPEYDRTVREHDTRGEAEAELRERVERRKQLDIRELAPETRERYAQSWREVQAQFVDSPEAAVASAHSLVTSVMSDRGYPVDNFEQRAADVSVDHPVVVQSYRSAQAIAEKSVRGEASTEELRQAMQHYRTLFEELLEPGADEPVSHRATADGTDKRQEGAEADERTRDAAHERLR